MLINLGICSYKKLIFKLIIVKHSSSSEKMNKTPLFAYKTFVMIFTKGLFLQINKKSSIHIT